MDNLEKIKRVNQHISEALKNWSNIMLTADADQWAYYLDYSDDDLLNAMCIFNHVWQNRAIKTGIFDTDNAKEKMEKFKNTIEDVFGIDTIELTNKVINKGKGEKENESKNRKD